jgi:ATP-dependent DNA helicase RecG
MIENSQWDKKSLRAITKSNPDWDELAKDCVAFANAYGGTIVFGIEDKMDEPSPEQKIPDGLPAKVQKQVQSRTVNVSVIPQLRIAENGGELLELLVQRNATAIAATSNGRYYIRIDDDCKPIMPDELSRLLSDKGAFVWETSTHMRIKQSEYDSSKLQQFVDDIQRSNRVSGFVKNKSNEELLEHYLFVSEGYLTNLGILWIGKREHRARLLFAPSVQFIKYNEDEQKVNKILWDDYSLNPKELILAILNDIPDWKEGIEVADGIFRKNILNYEESVIRELVANALVHRPYTIRGDIFINLFSDRLEIHNPGLMPLGVTPENILHKSVQRNPHLAKVFYDLLLMEKEGSGYDKIYETLLSNGKPLPEPKEENDRVVVKIRKRIINTSVIQFIDKVNREFQLRSKEIISLGLIAQHNTLTAIEFAAQLGLHEKDAIRNWLGRLPEFKLIKSMGKTKGMSYYVEPSILRKHDFKGKTDLKQIEQHRLHELIIADLRIYKSSSISEIHNRIGDEIQLHKIRKTLNSLLAQNVIFREGELRWTVYRLSE